MTNPMGERDVTNEKGACMFHYYAATNNIAKIREASEESLCREDFEGNVPQHYAVETGSYAVAEYLAKRFENEVFYNFSHITPGHIAARIGDLKMLEILSASPCVLKSPTYAGWQPLHFAVYYRRLNCVQFLVEKGINRVNDLINDFENNESRIQVTCLKYNSCLDLARYVNDTEIADYLISKGAFPSMRAACYSGNIPAVSYFATSRFSPFKEYLKSEEGQDALRIAAAKGNYQICQFLLEMGVPPKNSGSHHVLTVAVLSKSIETVVVVARHSHPDDVATACFLAADLLYEKVLNALLDCNVGIGAIEDGDSLIIRFLKRGLKNAAMKLIPMTKNFTHKDKLGRSVLHYAAAFGDIDLLRQIHTKAKEFDVNDQDAMKRINDQDSTGRIPLHYAIYAGKLPTTRFLRLANSNINVVDNCGFTPFIASLVLSQRLVEPNTESRNSKYSLNFAKLKSDLEPTFGERIVTDYITNTEKSVMLPNVLLLDDAMLQRCMEQNLSTDEMKDLSVLHAWEAMGAPFWGEEMFPFDEQTKKDVNLWTSVDGRGRGVIQLALRLRDTQLVERLMKHNTSTRECDSDKNTILHYVCDDAFSDIIQSILDISQATVYQCNVNKENPIHVACKNGAIKILKAFWANMKIDISAITAKDGKGKTPTDHARENGHNACMEVLFIHGAENELVRAIQDNNIQKAKELIADGYPVSMTDRNGWSPLHAAASLPNEELAELLISKGADPTLVTGSGLRAITCAAQKSSLPIIKAILSTGFRLTSMRYKDQPFHYANDPMVKRFLFDYWKREHYMDDIGLFLESRKDVTLVLATASKTIIATIPPEKTKGLNCVNVLERFIAQVNLLTMKIMLPRLRLQKKSIYNPNISMHHYLQGLQSLDVDSLARCIRQEFVNICELLVDEKGSTNHLMFHFNYVSKWIISITSILEKMRQHLIPEIDDIATFDEILASCMTRSTMICDEVTATMKIIYATMSNVFILPQDCKSMGYFHLYSSGRIYNIKPPSRVDFHPQTFFALKEFFGRDFVLPQLAIDQTRTVPVVMALFDEFLVLRVIEEERFFKFPLSLIDVVQPKGTQNGFGVYQVVTPVGSFMMQLAGEGTDLLSYAVADLCQTRRREQHDFHWGEIEFQKNENKKSFVCLVIYSQERENTIGMRQMIVRAERECECQDICYAQLCETLAAEPQNFRIRVKAMSEWPVICVI